jgi:hypothetical protein
MRELEFVIYIPTTRLEIDAIEGVKTAINLV